MKLTFIIRWVDLLPIDFQQSFVRKNDRIERNLNCFHVSCRSRFYLFIGRVFFMSSDISGDNAFDAWPLVEWLYHTPEASSGKCGFLKLRTLSVILHSSQLPSSTPF